MKYLLVFCVFVIAACENKPAPPPSKSMTINEATIRNRETANPYVQTDVSPMDMVYFPTDFPLKKMNGQETGNPLARVIYSRPHRGGRKLFGGLVKWGEPWRLGANEATEIEFFQPVTLQNKKLAKGRYILYAIPYEDKWQIIFNSNLYSWALKFDSTKDVLKVEIPVTQIAQLVEDFTLSFEKTTTGADLIMAWENSEARLPVQF